jgi:hypothetical protein
VNKTISVTVLLDGEASVAEARGSTLSNVGELSGTGSAKKHPNDSSDNEVGFNLAVSRALRALADQYETRANEAMFYTNMPQRVVVGLDSANTSTGHTVFFDGQLYNANPNGTLTVKR